MSFIEGIFGGMRGMVFPDNYGAAQQAAQEDINRTVWLQQNCENPYNGSELMNYRPPVEVPAGWAEWYAHADD